ncbi:uncharacterized protein LOC111303212 [Durio zibethinus]|uniref:Uncharacterized protein LOC111303212 n=1 Tax=Durio zibethinus TaxID=66656 RepID=A0A6P5ZR93_DURZI|nr:uncharacterized protein LOC111303212 [Durio zibethinus]
MVSSSLPLVLSASSFPSSSNPDSSPTSTFLRPISFKLCKPNPIFSKPLKYPPLKLLRCSSNETVEDGSVEQFFSNNSVADFLRLKRGNHRNRCELQTAVVSYRKRLPSSILNPFVQVDLVSTIHIADKDFRYFETLQKELAQYDCVLYEMVVSRESLENRRNPTAAKRLKSSRSRGFNILRSMQQQMARILMLDFQSDCLDYQDDNWYHADLDYETFKLLQFEKGESFFTIAMDGALKSTKALIQPASIPEDLDSWRSKLLWASRVLTMPLVGLLNIVGVCADVESQASDYLEVEALSMLDFGAAMKVFLAKVLTSEFTQVTAFPEGKSVVIGERNRAAIEALRRAIDDGHNKIAILYGGGHMPDMGRRLREEVDLVPSRVRWITAWSITLRDFPSSSFPFLKTMAEVSGWSLNRSQTLALLIFSSVLALDLWFCVLFGGTAVNWISKIASKVVQ